MYTIKTSTGYKADCPDCGCGVESLGHDASSRQAVRTFIREHTAVHTRTAVAA